MELFTKRGDEGTTDLLHYPGGIRKDHPAIAAVGSVDELNCEIGFCIAELTLTHPTVCGMLVTVQDALMRVQTDLGTIRVSACTTEDDVRMVEFWTKGYHRMSPELRNFILPGGSREAAILHRARAVCRRAERVVVSVTDQEQPLYREDGGTQFNHFVLQYLNRLSDFLFALARFANHKAGPGFETVWRTDTKE